MQRESLKYYNTRRDKRAGREGKKGRGWGARKMRPPPLRAKEKESSTWMMRRQPQDNGASALTTHQLQVERRENQVDGDY